MKTSQYLKKVIEVLEKNKWTKGAFVRNKYGHRLEDVNSASGVKFCALGACLKVSEGEYFIKHLEIDEYFDKAVPGYRSIPSFNDDPKTKKSDILRFFYRAMNHFKKLGD